MAQVIWTEPALHDLDSIADYIALDNPDAARRLVRQIFKRVELLADHPQLGPRVPELLPERRYRHLVVSPCRIFYRHDRPARIVYILAAMRGEREFQPSRLTKRDRA